MGNLASLYKIVSQQSINRSQRQSFVDRITFERDKAIALWYQKGGQLLIDWLSEHYCTYRGEPLRWDEPFLREYYLLFGNPWIEQLTIEKAAQMGYSESLIAMTAFFLGCLHLPIGVGFEENEKRREMVSKRFQPAFDHCLELQKLSKERRNSIGREDIDSQNTLTIGGVEATFFYANTKGVKPGDAKRQASSRLSSFSACAILADELELWNLGVLDITKKRMEASTLPTKPIRAGSTPGHEGGVIDRELKRAQYFFKWQVKCSHCSHQQFLDPFGNFLRSEIVTEDDGYQSEQFLSKLGRPLKWFFHNSTDPINSAYIGCTNCSFELDRTALNDGHFVCINTNETLIDFCDRVLQLGIPIPRVALRLPRIASVQFKPSEKLRDLLHTDNPSDAVQQGLGKVFSFGVGKISLRAIMNCIEVGSRRCSSASLRARRSSEVGSNEMAAPTSDFKKPDLIVLGIDQGKYANWGVLQHWYFADTPDKTQKWLKATKRIIWWRQLSWNDIDSLVSQHEIHVIGLDNEPEFNLAGDYALNHLPVGCSVNHRDLGQVYLIDQLDLKGVQFKRTERPLQAIATRKKSTSVPIYNIDRTYWLDKVRDRFYAKRTYLPPDTVYVATDPNNPIAHYLSSDRLTTGRWVESGADHYFHADSMGEAATLISLFEPGVKNKVAIGGLTGF